MKFEQGIAGHILIQMKWTAELDSHSQVRLNLISWVIWKTISEAISESANLLDIQYQMDFELVDNGDFNF